MVIEWLYARNEPLILDMSGPWTGHVAAPALNQKLWKH